MELNTEGKFLFRNYGMTAEEVLNTLTEATQQFMEEQKSDMANSLTEVKALLEKIWYKEV